MADTFKEKLLKLGYELPNPPEPKGAYLPVRQCGNIYFTSGTGANINGTRLYTGAVGSEVSTEDARKSAVFALLNNLANLYAVLGEEINNITILKLTGFVHSSPDFTEQAKVVDAASMLLFDLFGENGRHARSAVGMAALPFNLSVEIELVVCLNK